MMTEDQIEAAYEAERKRKGWQGGHCSDSEILAEIDRGRCGIGDWLPGAIEHLFLKGWIKLSEIPFSSGDRYLAITPLGYKVLAFKERAER